MKIKCLYITIYMFHVFLSRASVCLCMWGFQKEKIVKKKLRDQQRLPKKLRFLFKTRFSDKQFLVNKKIIYFSESVFPGVNDNISEEYVDLIVTQDCRSFRKPQNCKRFRTSYHGNNLFNKNFWIQDIQRAS